MEKSSTMHLIGKAAWLLTALASIHVGAVALFGSQYNLLQYLPQYLPEMLVSAVYALYLIAGVYSLVMLFMPCGCCE